MLVKVFEGYWSIDDVRANADYVFVYGDNDMHAGKGGQAVIRDEPNTHGIPTKKMPTNFITKAFYTDAEYEENVKKINDAFEKLLRKLVEGSYIGVMFPEDGLGTGLADLPRKAPRTFEYLVDYIEQMKKRIGEITK